MANLIDMTTLLGKLCCSMTDCHTKLIYSTGSQYGTDPLVEENQQLREENEKLRKELQMFEFGVNNSKDDDKDTIFYTGLPTFAFFMWYVS
ncbi:hypothetical protein MAR_003976 [Mya arenaria]|uniref:Uncharacterized protein n=1 Tax=Mya arenaria TaxID=6604 RepID=A0ABY7F3F2_MYAAR|nr:hypothetical protein MAR_003976 [Mya arenaria]